VLGRALPKHCFLVCSGGYGGVMESVSLGAKDRPGNNRGDRGFCANPQAQWPGFDVEVRIDMGIEPL